MVELKKILHGIDLVKTEGNLSVGISNLQFDSRKVQAGDLFIASKGTSNDGHQFISSALENGVKAIICEKFPDERSPGITWIKVKDSVRTLGIAASNFYNNPTSELKVIGITGTNGKTTVATLLYQVVREQGFGAGLISTIANYVNEVRIEATHTTPDPVQLNELFRKMVDEGCTHAFMEVSSHAIDQGRIEGIRFAGAVFTNLTHDHLDYHGTFADYLRTKKKFFDNLTGDVFAVVNSDDKNGKIMLQNFPGRQISYSLRKVSDYKVKIVEQRFEGMLLRFDSFEVSTRFLGEFNAYNLAAVYTVADQLGFDKLETLKIISNLMPVRGRLEIVRSSEGNTGIVDYAHTPDAVRRVIDSINEIRTAGMKLIIVIGAGGDRDKAKRAVMARIAFEGTDKTILTSDNPRSEKPEDIIKEMLEGIDIEERKKVLMITDRKEAIKTAVSLAGNNDIILVAGKGHETYQEINGVRHHFDDVEELKECFE